MVARDPKARIDVGVVIRDPNASLAFYRDTLGLDYLGAQPMSKGTRHLLKWGDSHLKLVMPDALPEASNPPGGSGGASGIRYLTIVTRSVENVFERCVKAGYRVQTPLKKMASGNTIAIVEDPDGNWVELLSPPNDERTDD